MTFDPSLHLTVLLCVLVAAITATIVLVHRQSVTFRIERLKAESQQADRAVEHRILTGATPTAPTLFVPAATELPELPQRPRMA